MSGIVCGTVSNPWQFYGAKPAISGCNASEEIVSVDAPQNMLCDSNWGGGGGGGGGGGCTNCVPEDIKEDTEPDVFVRPDVEEIKIDLPPPPPVGCELRWSQTIQPYAEPLSFDPKSNQLQEAYSEPIVVDLDGDGRQEIVIRSAVLIKNSEKVPPQVFVYDHTGALLWSQSLLELEGSNNFTVEAKSSCAAGELDGDIVTKEIVCSNAGQYEMYIMGFDSSGENIPGWPVYTGESYSLSLKGNSRFMLAMGNIVGKDAQDEVVAKTPGYLHLFKSNGELLSPWPQPVAATQSLALGDINGDGYAEIVTFSSVSALSCWKGDGSEVKGFPFGLKSTQGSGLSLADLDGKGDMEIILRQLKVGSSSARIDIIGKDGKLKTVLDVPGETPFEYPGEKDLIINSSVGNLGRPSLDLLHKAYSEKEFILPGGPVMIKKMKLYSYTYSQGALQQSFGVDVDPFDATEEEKGVTFSDYQALADIDGDGQMEILITSQETKEVMLRVFDAQGNLEDVLKRDYGDVAFWNSPAVGDLDGDGWIDLVIAGYEENNGGRIYNYECSGEFYSSSIEWPMHRHDFRGTINHSFSPGGE